MVPAQGLPGSAVSGSVVALGEQALIGPYLLAGAVLRPAETTGEVAAAWQSLPADTVVVLLTPAAAEVLGATAVSADGPMTVVMPGGAS